MPRDLLIRKKPIALAALARLDECAKVGSFVTVAPPLGLVDQGAEDFKPAVAHARPAAILNLVEPLPSSPCNVAAPAKV